MRTTQKRTSTEIREFRAEFVYLVATLPRIRIAPAWLGEVLRVFPVLGSANGRILIWVQGMTVELFEQRGLWVAKRLVPDADE